MSRPPWIERKARWRCLLCAADGIGGLTAWSSHYENNHYEPRGEHVQAHNYGDRQPH